MSLHVKCFNVIRGCEWVGTLRMLEEHVATCGFTLVPCPKQCQDENDEVKCFTRKDLDKHLKNDCPNRDYECQSKCGEKGTYAYITEVHDKTCKMKILPCPNDGCDTNIHSQQVSEHVSKCPHTVIPCSYKGIGCDTELKREDMAAHEKDDKLHLQMSLKIVSSQQDAIDSLRAAVKALQVEVYSQHSRLMMMKNDPGTFRLSKYKRKKESSEEFQFPHFYTHLNGYRMALSVRANGTRAGKGTHVSVYASVLGGENDSKLKWPLLGKIICTLLNQLEDRHHHTGVINLTTAHNGRVGSTWVQSQFIRHSALTYDPVKNTQYLKNDTLYFRMELETKS